MLGSKQKAEASTVATSSVFAVPVRLTRYSSRQRVLSGTIQHQPEQARRQCMTTILKILRTATENICRDTDCMRKRPCIPTIHATPSL
jgi:hypothetical protein